MNMNKNEGYGVYVGRFNPLHNGHIAIISKMLELHGPDRSLLVIGSSNADFSLRHFFSYAERRAFIARAFNSIRIVGLPDYNNDRDWLTALDDLIRAAGMDPREVTFFGGCDEDIRFFHDDKRNCYILNRFDGTTAKVSATEVRDALIYGRPLEDLVHPAIIPDIQKLFKEKWEKFKKI